MTRAKNRICPCGRDHALVGEPAQPAHAVESSVAADDWLAMSCTVGALGGAVFALKPNPPFQEEVRGIEGSG